MPNEITTISCPQCGSTDVAFENDVIQCHVCGVKTLLEQTETQFDEQEETMVTSDTDEVDCTKLQIITTFSKDDFIRKSWIALANEDAPIEVFKENFGEVIQNEHQVLVDKKSVDVSYQASVGYDREEPYIDYETYYEDEPYTTTETYYDPTTQSNRTRQVTKYKKVQKQRQVTKYKKVTDWRPLNGTHHASSTAIVENIEDAFLDVSLFENSASGVTSDTIFSLPLNEARNIHITKSAHDSAMKKHRASIYSSVSYSLPGDHSRDLDYTINDITEASSTIYKVEEYETSICFNGKTYSKHAFPFGTMKIGGDKIENEVNLDAITKRMKDELEERSEQRKENIEKTVWKETSMYSFISMGLFLISCIVSLFIPVSAIVVISFILAIGGYIYNKSLVKKKTTTETAKVESENTADKNKTEKEISEYSSNYKLKRREALNEKLKSLGFSPVTADEL